MYGQCACAKQPAAHTHTHTARASADKHCTHAHGPHTHTRVHALADADLCFNSPAIDKLPVLSRDCRNCDKKRDETISHDDNATAGRTFYHTKKLNSNITPTGISTDKSHDLKRDGVPKTQNENMSITQYGKLCLESTTRLVCC